MDEEKPIVVEPVYSDEIIKYFAKDAYRIPDIVVDSDVPKTDTTEKILGDLIE